ncbi:hypothetical protein ACLB1M_34655 [Escherichia coli]
MMEGGTAKIYHCNDSDKCLKVVADTPVTISRDNALKSQITKLLAFRTRRSVTRLWMTRKKALFPVPPSPSSNTWLTRRCSVFPTGTIYQLTDYIGYDILLQYIQGSHTAGPGDGGHRKL